ncbi:MAG: hypothetical protein ISR69_01230 [Gammaproteobacteria bacterium]|nr:hypothetical protein [Gammaproteobacteria bacterium]
MNEHDFILEEGDSQLLSLYKKTRLEHPHEALDFKVKQAAQQAIKADKKRRSRRVVWGLSIAAMLVLSFSVILNLVNAPNALSPQSIETQIISELSHDIQQAPSTTDERKEILLIKKALRQAENEQSKRRKVQSVSPSISEVSPSLMTADSAFEMSRPLSYLDVKLPFDLQKILQQFPDLKGLELNAKRFDIFYKGQRIAEFERTKFKQYRLTAYVGSRHLGLNIDWEKIPTIKNDAVKYIVLEKRLVAVSWLVVEK